MTMSDFALDVYYPIYSNHQNVSYFQQTSATDLTCQNKTFYHHYNSSDDSELETEEEFDFEDDDDYDVDDEEELCENIPSRLLDFVNLVTKDIRSLFERNKGSEDFCDVYEERFGTTLSGRELYYADLLELANSNNSRTGSKVKNPRSNAEASCAFQRCSPNPGGHQMHLTGRCVSEYGLGPLEELFKKTFDNSVKKNSVSDTSNFMLATSSVPMTMRKLPNSFWQEPGIHSKENIDSVDFTDLFSQWSNDK